MKQYYPIISQLTPVQNDTIYDKTGTSLSAKKPLIKCHHTFLGRKSSIISRTESQNLNVSRLVLLLFIA